MAKSNGGNMGTLVLVGALGVGAMLLMSKKSNAATAPSTFPEAPTDSPFTEDGSTTSNTSPENDTVQSSRVPRLASNTGIVQSATDNFSDEEKIQAVTQAGTQIAAALAFNLPVAASIALPEALTVGQEAELIDKGEITEEIIMKHPVVAKKILSKKSSTTAVKISNTLIAATAGIPMLAALAQLTTGVNRKKKAERNVKFVVNKAVLVNNVKKAGGTKAVVAKAKVNGKPTAAGQALQILASPKAAIAKKAKAPVKKAVKKPVPAKKVVKKPIKKALAKKPVAKKQTSTKKKK